MSGRSVLKEWGIQRDADANKYMRQDGPMVVRSMFDIIADDEYTTGAAWRCTFELPPRSNATGYVEELPELGSHP